MVSISVCMIVKNEEAVLERCLDSLQGLYEELIIVDTGSTDKTKEIAARYTDKIYDFNWINDFAAARNFAFSKATMEYIYSADADEKLEEIDRKKFLQLKQVLLPEIEIVEMIYVNPEDCNAVYNFAKEPRPKLFKRLREFRWIDPVHETVALDPLVYSSDIEIMHLPQTLHSSRDFAVMERELNRSGRLSERLYSMYAKELFISGEVSDFERALPWFFKRREQEELSEDAKIEALCVLAKGYLLTGQKEEFLSLCMNALAEEQKLPSEVCFLLGEYYEKSEKYAKAVEWYRCSAVQSECYVALRYGGIAALDRAICLLKQLGRAEEVQQYEAYRLQMER